MIREPGLEEIALIKEKLNQMRASWELLREAVSFKVNRREELQQVLRDVIEVKKMVQDCLDGKAPHILREREIQHRRERDRKRGTVR